MKPYSQPTNYYKKKIKDIEIDVYDVLMAYQISNPATAHAIKKLLRMGTGHKTSTLDLDEAIQSLHRAKELENAPK